ncbi:hypothetical protein [Pontibacter flavimaris]|uniref:hypothetical protein n=1 Tax=Pontibacter flavimaris TaxID=1797110 RepID=UPI001115276E|nr:hypothetical protein [Pontibacter flavimaris]
MTINGRQILHTKLKQNDKGAGVAAQTYVEVTAGSLQTESIKATYLTVSPPQLEPAPAVQP